MFDRSTVRSFSVFIYEYNNNKSGNCYVVWCLTAQRLSHISLRPPSHQTKTALPTENFDERSAVVVKMEKCVVFKFILRLYYVPARFSLRLTCLCQVLTTSNTFPLISYHAHYHAHATSNSFLLRPIRSHHMLNMRLPRSH